MYRRCEPLDLAVVDDLPGQVGEDRRQHDGAADGGPRRRRLIQKQPDPDRPENGLGGAEQGGEGGGNEPGALRNERQAQPQGETESAQEPQPPAPDRDRPGRGQAPNNASDAAGPPP